MKRILVVDDDKILRVFLKRHLEKQGYLVEDVTSGVEALSVFQRQPPDLVVSDVMMPEMDGFEFCRRLRSDPQGKLVPFIFLSSKGELDDRIEGHSMGADDYLSKPFEPLELVAKIDAQLERSHRIHSEIVRLIQQFAECRVPPACTPPLLPQEVVGGGVPEGMVDSSATLYTPQHVTPLALTPAEGRVFWEVILGYTNKQIAAHLFISPRTVQTHLSHILNKLNLDNRSQLVRFAFERGYRPPSENANC